jgi:hypothetical protein
MQFSQSMSKCFNPTQPINAISMPSTPTLPLYGYLVSGRIRSQPITDSNGRKYDVRGEPRLFRCHHKNQSHDRDLT